MKKYNITILILNVIAIILEALPFGAVCNFATPEKTIRETFSYFSLVPFGYASFGPFLTAILTCILLVLSVILLLKSNCKITNIAFVVSAISVVTSLLPLMFGINYYSVTGGAISALLILEAALLFLMKKRMKNET